MNFILNIGAKLTGVWGFVSNQLPLLAALGPAIAVIATIVTRASGAKNAADLIAAAKPTGGELSVLSSAVAVIKLHFNHQANAAAIEDHSTAIAAIAPEKPQ